MARTMAKKTIRTTKNMTSAEKPQIPFVGKLQLLGIRLVESASKIGLLKTNQLPEHGTQSINFVHITNSNDPKATAVSVQIKLDFSYDAEATKEPAISILANFVANYSIVEDFPDEKIFEKFQQHIGIANIWPYWREFVQSMTTRMGLPAFPVPLVNIAELKTEDEKPAS
jgi:hypothetical protein